MSSFSPDDARLKELILHVSARCADWDDFDPFLLERILFQSDFLHFREHGTPITGQTYRRGLMGPSPRGMARVLKTLARDFAVQETPLGDGLHVRRRPRALREADLGIFDGQELVTVEEVIAFYRWNRLVGETGRGAGAGPSDLVEVPWESAGLREEIPYALALVGQAQGLSLALGIADSARPEAIGP